MKEFTCPLCGGHFFGSDTTKDPLVRTCNTPGCTFQWSEEFDDKFIREMQIPPTMDSRDRDIVALKMQVHILQATVSALREASKAAVDMERELALRQAELFTQGTRAAADRLVEVTKERDALKARKVQRPDASSPKDCTRTDGVYSLADRQDSKWLKALQDAGIEVLG